MAKVGYAVPSAAGSDGAAGLQQVVKHRTA